MADLSGVTTNYLPTSSEVFSDNLSASIAAGATTVPVNNASEYTTGDVVVLTVDAGTVNEATFTGVKDTGNQFINCVWTEGNTAVGHSNGASIVDYDSATHYNMVTKALKLILNQNGTLKTQPIRDALGLGAAAVNGWEVFPSTVTVGSGYANGNRSYTLTVSNYDATAILSKHMKMRFARGTTPGTQCADFESSSSQYASRASGSLTGSISTMTDDITAEAWLKLESYTGGIFISRYNGTSGFRFYADTNGQVFFAGYNGGAGNYRGTQTYQSLELSKWTHVAGTLDMSGFTTATNATYFNGVSVPIQLIQAGTNPTAFIQAGNLEIGSANATSFFDGLISDVRVWNVVRTQLQIRDNMNQQLTGSETNLVGYWKLAGNFNDSTSSANNLTANAGVAATFADNPFKSTEYGLIMDVSYSAPNSTIVLQVPEGFSIPNGTLSSPYYSVQDQPYGFVKDENRWVLNAVYHGPTEIAGGAAASSAWVGAQLLIPQGEWTGRYRGGLRQITALNNVNCYFDLNTAATGSPVVNVGPLKTNLYEVVTGSTAIDYISSVTSQDASINLTTPTTYNLHSYTSVASTSRGIRGDYQPFYISAMPAGL